jgi:hypothetical protein
VDAWSISVAQFLSLFVSLAFCEDKLLQLRRMNQSGFFGLMVAMKPAAGLLSATLSSLRRSTFSDSIQRDSPPLSFSMWRRAAAEYQVIYSATSHLKLMTLMTI